MRSLFIVCLSTTLVAAGTPARAQSIDFRAAAVRIGALLLQPLPRPLPVEDWSQIAALKPGTIVRITEAGNRRTVGRVMAVNESWLAVSDGQESRTINRASIAAVERRLPNHKARNGFLTGAAFGLGLSLLTIHHGGAGTVTAWSSMLTFGWGGLGAAAGGISSVLDRGYETVFQSGAGR
jgi:hypothetical protein